MDQFYPPLNIDNVFNRSLNDKVMARFGFNTDRANPGMANQISKSYSHNLNFQPNLRNNTYYNNMNKYKRYDNSSTLNLVKVKTENVYPRADTMRFQTNYDISYGKYDPYEGLRFSNYNYSVPASSTSNSIIRKLGQNEKIFHGSLNNNASYIFRAAIVTSEIDLYKNINLLNEAIEQWKMAHPLLRCRVVTKNPNEYPNNTGKVEKYFAFATEAKLKSMDNVKYLYYDSHSSKSCDDIWKLLVEKETTMAMDGENGLLWRLTFFQIKNKIKNETTSQGSHLYAIILAFDHCILDGRSSYNALLELISIIEELSTSNMQRQAKEIVNILPSKEDLFKNRQQSIETMFNQRFYIKAPEFIDQDNAFRSTYIKLKYLTDEEEKFGMIYHHDNRPYCSIRELVQISRSNNSKFRTLVITKPDLSKLLKKCKEHGVKLTSFINLANALAIRMMYDKFDRSSSHRNTQINYTTNVSLREYPEYKNYNLENYETIGCYIGLSFNSVRDSLKFQDSTWASDFWRIAKRESADFHERLDKGEYIHPIILPAKRKDRDEFFYHFGNSNLGVLDSSVTERKLIKIRQAFATGRYSKENFLCWYSNLIATIDGQLCWTISFNTYFIRQELIDCLIENLTKVIRELSRH